MSSAPLLLIAEDNTISRELMCGILKSGGYRVIDVASGQDAITAIRENKIDLALIDLNMEPVGGFELIRYMLVNGIKVPVVIVTADESSDVLTRASELGVLRVLQKPVSPQKLNTTVQRILRQNGFTLSALTSAVYETRYTHEQLMQYAIELAERNANSKKGGPFGAVVADQNGSILGEGTNGITSRVDPIAHAEIMAIRQAAEKLGRADLSDCILYCSSEPTMMGQALIISVGIAQVYYGLSHADIQSLREKDRKVRAELSGHHKPQTTYTQLGHDYATTVLNRWQSLKDKVVD